MPPKPQDDEQVRSAAREALILRMEEIATTNAQAAQIMAEAAETMSEQMADLSESMKEVVSHLKGWEKFVNQFLATYKPQDGVKAREDFLNFMQGLFTVAKKFRG